MYRVKGDGITIYDDSFLTESVKAVNPKLTLKDNSAGTFEIAIPPGNAGYDKLERMISEIVVYRDKKEIWSGRIIGEKKDFWNNRIITCEGELAYLNDTTQPPAIYEDISIRVFLGEVLNNHNKNVGADKQFTIGAVTFNDADTYPFSTNDEKTLSVIGSSLIDRFGGHLRIRKEDGVRYLDYLKEWPSTNTQEIRFGQNLLDFTRNWDMTDLITVVLPRGESLEDRPIPDLDAYLDVSSVNGGSRYVTNEDGISRFGWIEEVVDWDYISDPEELLKVAKEYLNDKQFDKMTIEVTSVDLRYLGITADSIRLLDEVRCISKPHGLDKILPVSELTIQFDKPENSTYVLGSETKESFTSSTINKSESKKSEQKLTNDAFYNATQIINSATRGHVTIQRSSEGTESIAISSDKTYNPETDLWSPDTKLWRWNINGLGYSKDGGRTYSGIAITMDGSISADFIRTGKLTTVVIEDESGNSSWNLKTGVLTMQKGTITLGKATAYPDGRFSVNDSGYLRAEYGLIGGFTINSSSIYNSKLRLDSNGLTMKDSSDELGLFGTRSWIDYPSHKGIVMDLEYSSTPRYITWSNRDHASDPYFTVKLSYASRDVGPGRLYGGLAGDALSIGCNIEGNSWVCEGLYFNPYYGGANGGFSSSRRFILPYELNEDGTIKSYSNVSVYGGFVLS